MLRTHNCGELNASNIGTQVTLCGWVNKARDLGGMTFIDLRDRYGITQVTIDPSKIDTNVSEIKSEYVLSITGNVVARPDNMINKDMKTGEVEIQPTKVEIISTSGELPFSIDHENAVGEDIRLEYRYLDLRRKTMNDNIMMRHKLYMQTLNFFDSRDFVNIETPSFIKNTPEGSREYVVPARFDPGKFFVLPQSPQQHKQMLMVAGFDKYIQIARCFRDEDPRGDRQPEFTQVDFEMSFVEQEDVLQLMQDYFLDITHKSYPNKRIKLETFPRITWEDAMNLYGSDKPELRTTELSFTDMTDWAHGTEFGVFKNAPCVKALVVNKEYSRSEIERDLEPVIKENGGKGLAYVILTEEGPKSGIVKFFTEEQINELIEKTGAQTGDTIFFQATEWLECVELLGALRIKLIKDLNILEGKEDELDFTFVVDFPMFEINGEGYLAANHHPFTKPKDGYIPYLIELAKKMREGYTLTDEDKKKLLEVKSDGYDVVCCGYELGGGSIRIHNQELQHAIFTLLGLTEEQIQERFGHILKAFSFGVPPHGGCAFGFDRIVMVYQNMPNIREVMPFPKNQKYKDPMLNAPSEIDPELVDELGLMIKERKED